MYTEECLETLRQRIDLVDVLSSHIELKRSGATFKALCPFHEEKTPSFIVKRGDPHYHCFGCGAHGDAIHFLMQHAQMGFPDAVEFLAERFGVTLIRVDQAPTNGPKKSDLKQVLEMAARFFHAFLLYSQEGQTALRYLYSRGIDLAFIQHFQIGLAPGAGDLLLHFLKKEGVEEEKMMQTGLIRLQQGRNKDFFTQRIVFPIQDRMGAVIGFSGRKFLETTRGGKYVNTPETPLFKKSQILFGLFYCRKRIVQEKRVLIVEGQIDALRLIQMGFTITVAGQGTAFGSDHVQELIRLNVKQAYLALDSDSAGLEAACKIGDLFQKKGIDVHVLVLPKGKDPDTLLREEGPQAFQKRIETSERYLTFLIHYRSKGLDLAQPAIKSQLAEEIAMRIRSWEHPVLIHESLRQLALLLSLPEEVLGIREYGVSTTLKKRESAKVSGFRVDPQKILEIDLLRWVLLSGELQTKILHLVTINEVVTKMRTPICQKILQHAIEAHASKGTCDFFSLASRIDPVEGPPILEEILQKKINLQKAEEGFLSALKELLERQWLEEAETIRLQIQSGRLDESETLELAKRFSEIKKHPPQLRTQ